MHMREGARTKPLIQIWLRIFIILLAPERMVAAAGAAADSRGPSGYRKRPANWIRLLN